MSVEVLGANLQLFSELIRRELIFSRYLQAVISAVFFLK